MFELDAKKIGKKLQELRGDRPRTVVAQAVGVSTSALAMYEQGERIPRDTIKIKIATYYNRSIEEIFFI